MGYVKYLRLTTPVAGVSGFRLAQTLTGGVNALLTKYLHTASYL